MKAGTWATRLAEEIAPDEALLAPIIADAYIAGGKTRAELFAVSGHTHGAFGAGEMLAVLPFALKALGIAAPAVIGLLTSSIASDVLECAKSALNVVELHKGTRSLLEQRAAAAGPAATAGSLEQLRIIVDVLPRELKASGLTEDQSSVAALRIVRALLAEPESAKGFVEQLGARA